MTMNMHNLNHVIFFVKQFGPWTGYSCFPFEDMLGYSREESMQERTSSKLIPWWAVWMRIWKIKQSHWLLTIHVFRFSHMIMTHSFSSILMIIWLISFVLGNSWHKSIPDKSWSCLLPWFTSVTGSSLEKVWSDCSSHQGFPGT